MFKLASKIIIVLFASFVAANTVPDVFLPPDANSVTIVGNGFTVQVNQNQLNQAKDQWKEVAAEAATIVAPRDDKSGNKENNAITNNNLFEKTIETVGAKTYGQLDADLLDWITLRARALVGKIERYQSEASYLQQAEERLVVEILLLNTLTDLENLVKENIHPLKWIKKKLRLFQNSKTGHAQQVDDWLQAKIQENIKIEKKIKSTNKPTKDWLKNTAQIKRVLHEQRFSDDISKTIVGYIGGTFAMMERATVFDLNRSDRNLLNDGLYYMKAKGRVPSHFPFSAQDAIVDEA